MERRGLGHEIRTILGADAAEEDGGGHEGVPGTEPGDED